MKTDNHHEHGIQRIYGTSRNTGNHMSDRTNGRSRTSRKVLDIREYRDHKDWLELLDYRELLDVSANQGDTRLSGLNNSGAGSTGIQGPERITGSSIF